MKKFLKVVVIIVLVISFMCSCSIKKVEKVTNTDGLKFKEEYEKLNDKNIKVNISDNNKIKYASYEEVMKLLDKGTGVIYFGFPMCPWCRTAVPVLLNSAEDTDIKEILYFNALSIRDKKHLDENGNIIVDKEGTQEYYQLVEKLSEYLSPYETLNDESIKRLYFPTVVFVKDGQVIGIHEGTVESQKDVFKELTKAQKDELYNIYTIYIQKVLGVICDEDRAC